MRIESDRDPEARLLDLRKTYSALWEILKRFGMNEPFLETVMDLHESTAYCVKGRGGNSAEWNPEKCLREGCPSSPALFNVFHQVVMRLTSEWRVEKAEEEGKSVGIPWSWIPGSRFPRQNRAKCFNSDTKMVRFSLSLFADDTTSLGREERSPNVLTP